MDSEDLEVLRSAHAWLSDPAATAPVALVTVARTWGSSPRPPGALLAVRSDGLQRGSVSGGCVEAELIERLGRQPPQPGRPEVIVYGVSAQETQRLGLPCGGRLELIIEALTDARALAPLLDAATGRQLVKRSLDLQTGEVRLQQASREQDFHYDEFRLERLFGPQWRLLLIGSGQLSRCVAELALAMDYEVIVCDPRREQAAAWAVPGAALIHSMPDEAVLAHADDPRSAVLALTHDPRLDDMALMEALRSRAGYVGALGSHSSTAARRERLATLGLRPAQLQRLHGPVGLPIGSRRPMEIAVAILAELTAERHGVKLAIAEDGNLTDNTGADITMADNTRAGGTGCAAPASGPGSPVSS